jgi:hypothetical protein
MTGDDDPFGADEPEPASSKAGEESTVTTHFGSADEFVRKQLVGTYRRRVIAHGSGGGYRWKAAWWESKEAQQRIEALWRAWEAARSDEKAGMSAWWIEHCDPHMSVLLSPDGPFADSTDENRLGDPLPYQAPDEGLFPKDEQPPLLTKLLAQEASGPTT